MDFAFDERTEQLRGELLAFMDEHVYPAEPVFERSRPAGPVSWDASAGHRGAAGRSAPRAGCGTCSCRTPSVGRA